MATAPKIKREVLEIKDWQSGVSSSPYSGISVIANLDVSKSGALLMNNKPVASASTIDGYIKYWAKYNDTFYGQTSSGKIYQSTDNCVTWTLLSGNSLSRASGNGLTVYKNKLYAAREVALDTYDLITGTWATGYSGFFNIGAFNGVHTLFVGQDDIMYMANGNTVASFNGTSWNQNALDLPAGYSITSFSEQGQMLLIGTVHTSKRRADIFPWDRVSPSFDIPVRIGENGVYQMIEKDNLTYAVCGDDYTLYVTNGVTSNRVISVGSALRATSNIYAPHFSPQEITSTTNYRGTVDASSGSFPSTGGSGSSGSIMFGDMWQVSVAGTLGTIPVSIGDIIEAATNNPGQDSTKWSIIYSSSSIGVPTFFCDAAIALFGNKILLGMNVRAKDTGDSSRYPFGVWSWDGNKLQLESLISDGTVSIDSTGGIIGCIIPATDYSFAYSWSTSTSGIDVVSRKAYFHANYEPFYESSIQRVGTKHIPYTFQTCEIELAKPLSVGQGIRVKYRKNITDNWSDICTFDYATYKSANTIYFPFAGKLDIAQFRIEFTTNGTDISSPELLVLRFT